MAKKSVKSHDRIDNQQCFGWMMNYSPDTRETLGKSADANCDDTVFRIYIIVMDIWSDVKAETIKLKEKAMRSAMLHYVSVD